MQSKPWGRLQGVRPSKPFHRWLDQGMSVDEAAARMQDHYGVSPEKAALLAQVAMLERPVLIGIRQHSLSVYLGVPYCPTRCLYCSFPSHSLRELGSSRQQFVRAVVGEIEQVGQLLQEQGFTVDSVYLGGGTPTALAPAELEQILVKLREALPQPWQEFSVEAGRPETLSLEHLALLQRQDVQRISINPQTRHERTLRLIGRNHTAESIEQAYAAARPLFPVINMDLILGLPGEDLPMVEDSLQWVLGMRPENVTIHMFSPKRASRYVLEGTAAGFEVADAETAQAMAQRARQLLQQAGYRPYYLYRQRNILGGQENIGWALPGTECRYNILMIEERQHILGFGGGACSKFLNADHSLQTLCNPRDVLMYIDRVGELTRRKIDSLLERSGRP